MLAISTPSSRVDPAHAVLRLVDTCDSLGAVFLDGALRTLNALLADPGLLDGVPVPQGTSSERTLLWSDPMNRFGIWALWWPAGSQTPIHDHHCSCAFGVYRGAIDEILYEVRDEQVIERQCCVREEGYVGGGQGRGVHRMRNSGEQLAVSIHLYTYHPRLHENSIGRRFPEPRHDA